MDGIFGCNNRFLLIMTFLFLLLVLPCVEIPVKFKVEWKIASPFPRLGIRGQIIFLSEVDIR